MVKNILFELLSAPWGPRGMGPPGGTRGGALASNLLIKLSQTAYFDGLTLPDCRKWYGDSIGLNITL